MKAGIVIEPWKLEVFVSRLTNAGYKPSEPVKMVEGTLLLTVEFHDPKHLQRIITKATREAQLCRPAPG